MEQQQQSAMPNNPKKGDEMSSHDKCCSPRVQEAAAMLVFFSFFSLIEGIIRMTMYSKPFSLNYFSTANTANGIPFLFSLLAGVAETFFGCAGLGLALSVLVWGRGNARTTSDFLLVQCILGVYVFFVFAVAAPLVAARQTTGIPNVFTAAQHERFLLCGNLVASVTFCWALQGGQFVMAMRLRDAQEGVHENLSHTQWRTRMWSANTMVAAVSTLYVGSTLDGSEFSVPISAPPHVVRFPLLSIATGLVLLAYGVLGLLSASQRYLAVRVLPFAWVMTTLVLLVNFSWTFGIVPVPPIPGAAQHAGLVWAVTLLPVFHAWRSHVQLYEGDDDDEDIDDDWKLDTTPERDTIQPPGKGPPVLALVERAPPANNHNDMGWDDDQSVRV